MVFNILYFSANREHVESRWWLGIDMVMVMVIAVLMIKIPVLIGDA